MIYKVHFLLATIVLSAGLMSCQAMRSRSNALHSLQTETYTASDNGFAASSHLLYDENEAILVDAQFTRSDAVQVVKMIKNAGRPLSTIFITHGHPDHYFGLETILTAFPKAKVIARPAVVQEIRKTYQAKLKYWKPIYKGELPETVPLPKIHRTNLLMLGGQRIDVIDVKGAESRVATALYIPSLQTLVSGDLLYNGVHLWLADTAARPRTWRQLLDRLPNFGPIEVVLPGHGAEGDANVIEENKEYLDSFTEILKTAGSKQEAIDMLKAKYADYRLPIIAELSVSARKK